MQTPRRVLALFFTTALLGCLPPTLAAAPEDAPAGRDQNRPRIGLVLAGGGARGIGHVGVIRMLEELNIEVDYVAGTSMGSIVGGLYCAGYTSDEMLEWLKQTDWERLLSDSLPRQERGYRAKAEELDTPRWAEFGIDKSGLKVPNAFISGQNLLVALRDLTGFVGPRSSFDSLPVPFRAVATDVETGAMVVIDHGSLADAMRASMAVPGVFAPHTVDGRVLIDGFASRNLPISVVRDMGADVIIAVDVRPELLPADQLTSPIAMAEQLISILSQRDTLEQIETLDSNDVLVRLKLPGYESSSFPDALDIAALGYAESEEFRDALATLTLPPELYAAGERSRRSLPRNAPVIAAIEVEGNDRVAEAAVRKRLNIRTGEPLDPDELEYSLGRVHDLGYFKSVDYRIEDRPEGKVLVVRTEPKPWGPNFLLFGIGLESNLDGSSEINVRASLRFTQLNRLGAEIPIQMSMGTVDRLDAEFFQPVDYTGTFFLAPRGEFLRTPEAYLVDFSSLNPDVRPQQVTFERQTFFGGLAGGLRIGTYGEFRVGVESGSVRNTDIQAPAIIVIGPDGEIEVVDLGDQLINYTTDRIYTSLTLDQLDDAFFPRHGYYLNGSINHETGQYGTTTGSLQMTTPFPFGSFVIQPRLAVDYTLDQEAIVARLPFRVGGLFNLSGVPTDELYGSNAFVGAIVVRKRLGGGEANDGVFIGGSVEAGNVWEESNRYLPADWIFAGSAFLAASTPLGPVHLAVGIAEGHSPTIYFTLGRVLP
ncbi:MAG: patatin-like phospholipase family protein [Opitutaceae bacterium]